MTPAQQLSKVREAMGAQVWFDRKDVERLLAILASPEATGAGEAVAWYYMDADDHECRSIPRWGFRPRDRDFAYAKTQGHEIGYLYTAPQAPAPQAPKASAQALTPEQEAMEMLWNDQPLEEKEHYLSVVRRAKQEGVA